jgi:bisphosphoglycerate-independent phosphoglycerate mutase (AlkP superfamily)
MPLPVELVTYVTPPVASTVVVAEAVALEMTAATATVVSVACPERDMRSHTSQEHETT